MMILLELGYTNSTYTYIYTGTGSGPVTTISAIDGKDYNLSYRPALLHRYAWEVAYVDKKVGR